jgi:hypothetical protein
MRTLKPMALAIGLALACGPLFATPAADIDARLSRMEARWDRIEAELAALRAEVQATSAPDATTITPALDARVATVEDAVSAVRGDLQEVASSVSVQRELIDARSEAESRSTTLSSYGTLVYNDFQDRNSAFDASSFELVVSGQPSPRVSFFSEIEFERAAAVGGRRGGEVLLEQAYVDLGLNDHWSFRAGVLLMPFGNKSVDHFSPVREVVAQPLSAYAIAPSDWADNGLGLVGGMPINDNWSMEFSAYAVAGLGSGIGEYDFRRGPQEFGVDNNNNKSFIGRAAFNHTSGSVLGVAVYRGAYDDAGDLGLNGFALDGVFKLGRWRWTGELLGMSAQRLDGSHAEAIGGYVRTIFDLDPGALKRLTGEGFPELSWALVHEYDHVRLESLLQREAPSHREWKNVIGMLFSLQHNWIFKLNREFSGYSGAPVVNGDADAWQLSVGYVF